MLQLPYIFHFYGGGGEGFTNQLSVIFKFIGGRGFYEATSIYRQVLCVGAGGGGGDVFYEVTFYTPLKVTLCILGGYHLLFRMTRLALWLYLVFTSAVPYVKNSSTLG